MTIAGSVNMYSYLSNLVIGYHIYIYIYLLHVWVVVYKEMIATSRELNIPLGSSYLTFQIFQFEVEWSFSTFKCPAKFTHK